MRIDKAPDGGKFRARAAAAFDGEPTAPWGDGDLVCVAIDGNGELVEADGTNVAGIIWTPEGKKSVDLANYKHVIGGDVYTVFFICELVEAETAADPALAAGDVIYGDADGGVNVDDSLADGTYIGTVLDSGSRIIVRVGQAPAGAGA